jgi:hypothetical protein
VFSFVIYLYLNWIYIFLLQTFTCFCLARFFLSIADISSPLAISESLVSACRTLASRGLNWGQCYDYYFLRFSPILSKIGLFHNQCYDKLLSLFWVKTANFGAKNIFNNHNRTTFFPYVENLAFCNLVFKNTNLNICRPLESILLILLIFRSKLKLFTIFFLCLQLCTYVHMDNILKSNVTKRKNVWVCLMTRLMKVLIHICKEQIFCFKMFSMNLEYLPTYIHTYTDKIRYLSHAHVFQLGNVITIRFGFATSHTDDLKNT